jgi:hypothetical protein
MSCRHNLFFLSTFRKSEKFKYKVITRKLVQNACIHTTFMIGVRKDKDMPESQNFPSPNKRKLCKSMKPVLSLRFLQWWL